MTLELGGVSFVATQEFATFTTGSPFNDDITFSSDGFYAYTMASESGAENIYRFPLSSAWTLSTVSASDKKFDLEGLVALINHRGHTWNAAGTKLYVADIANNLDESFIQEFTLSVAWDPSTITGVVTKDISGTIGTGALGGIDVVGTDGYLFAVDKSTPSIVKFTMTAGDISTLADSGDRYTTTPLTASPGGVRIGKDGTRLYINQEWPSVAYQLNLSVGYDITTISDSGNSLAIATELPGEQTSGFAIKSTGTGTQCIYFSAFNSDMDMLQYCQAADTIHGICYGGFVSAGNGPGNGQICQYTFDDTVGDVGHSSTETYKDGGEAREAVNVITGLVCLEGYEVAILADGGQETNQTVTDYKITIPDGRLVARAAIGLPYTTDIETLDIEVRQPPATIQGKYKKISEVMLRFYRSRMPMIGPNNTDMTEIKQREFEKYGEATTLLTGDAYVTIPPSWNSNGRLFIRNRDPIPFTLLGIFPNTTLEDEIE